MTHALTGKTRGQCEPEPRGELVIEQHGAQYTRVYGPSGRGREERKINFSRIRRGVVERDRPRRLHDERERRAIESSEDHEQTITLIGELA